jgi:hypothetical protein
VADVGGGHRDQRRDQLRGDRADADVDVEQLEDQQVEGEACRSHHSEGAELLEEQAPGQADSLLQGGEERHLVDFTRSPGVVPSIATGITSCDPSAPVDPAMPCSGAAL